MLTQTTQPEPKSYYCEYSEIAKDVIILLLLTLISAKTKEEALLFLTSLRFPRALGTSSKGCYKLGENIDNAIAIARTLLLICVVKDSIRTSRRHQCHK